MNDMRSERVRTVVHEITQGRLDRDEKLVAAYVKKAFGGLSTADQAHILEGVLQAVPPKPTARPKPRPVDGILRGKALIAAAAAVLRKQPELTASAVYSELAKVHRIAMSVSSFAAMATEARKLARGKAPLPEVSAPARKPEQPAQRPRTAVARRPAATVEAPVAPPPVGAGERALPRRRPAPGRDRRREARCAPRGRPLARRVRGERRGRAGRPAHGTHGRRGR